MPPRREVNQTTNQPVGSSQPVDQPQANQPPVPIPDQGAVEQQPPVPVASQPSNPVIPVNPVPLPVPVVEELPPILGSINNNGRKFAKYEALRSAIRRTEVMQVKKMGTLDDVKGYMIKAGFPVGEGQFPSMADSLTEWLYKLGDFFNDPRGLVITAKEMGAFISMVLGQLYGEANLNAKWIKFLNGRRDVMVVNQANNGMVQSQAEDGDQEGPLICVNVEETLMWIEKEAAMTYGHNMHGGCRKGRGQKSGVESARRAREDL